MSKARRSLIGLVIAFVLAAVALFGFTACDGAQGGGTEPASQAEFVFEGQATFSNGVDYSIVITGYKDNSFLLTVKEMPILEMDGTWTMVEGKGYKLYLNDAGGTYVYTSYDTAAKAFTAKVPVNLGGGFGSTTVTMTCADEAFASLYDGEGLPPHPPTFTGHGLGGTKGNSEYLCSLICFEDGTCVAVTDKTGIPNRNGVYTYDSETNTYSFEFEDETEAYDRAFIYENDEGVECYYHTFGCAVGDVGSTATTEKLPVSDGIPHYNTSTWYYDADGNKVETQFKTTYDEATKTYTLIYEAYCRGFVDRLVTYTVED